MEESLRRKRKHELLDLDGGRQIGTQHAARLEDRGDRRQGLPGGGQIQHTPVAAAQLVVLLWWVQYLVSARTVAAALAPIVPSLSARLLDVLDAPGASGPPVPRLELSPRH